jgi:hypothetical protein
VAREPGGRLWPQPSDSNASANARRMFMRRGWWASECGDTHGR